MTCNQMGGACDMEFHANSFEEIASQSKEHGMQMFKHGDEAHLTAIKKMKALMTSLEDMQDWCDSKRKEFETL